MNTIINNTIVSTYFTVGLQLSVIFVFLLAAIYIKNKIINKAEEKVSKRPNLWNEAVLSSIASPTTVLIWLLFLSHSLKILATLDTDIIIFSDINHYIKSVGVIFVFAWFLIELVTNVEKSYFKSDDKDSTLDKASSYILGKVLRVSIFAIASIIILQTLGYSLTALLTVGGAASFAASFAAKDILANFFGGLMVFMDKPFKVGDMIKTDAHKLEGTIEKIGWRTTRMRNYDKRPVYVPNNIWTNAPVENVTRMLNRRIKEIIGVRYKDADKIAFIVRDIEAMLEEHEGVDHRQNLIVRFQEFGPSSLNFMLYVFTKATKLKDFLTIKQDILLKVIEIVHKHGADFAFPTTTLDLPEQVVEKITS